MVMILSVMEARTVLMLVFVHMIMVVLVVILVFVRVPVLSSRPVRRLVTMRVRVVTHWLLARHPATAFLTHNQSP